MKNMTEIAFFLVLIIAQQSYGLRTGCSTDDPCPKSPIICGNVNGVIFAFCEIFYF
jgi:hypothetical protein